jgi:gamma-glutamyltranspeptidase/glutathione hydrolase
MSGDRISSPAGSRGIVVTAHPAATEAGCEVLAAGGNAIDAAVAAAWALCVCEPSGSGVGGQTVLLVRQRGETVAIDGHSRAPAGASTASVTRAQQRRGHRATTVPTTPATLDYAQARYGALPAVRTLAPAIRLAEEGYEITPLQHRQLRWCRQLLTDNEAASRYLDGGHAYRPGELFVQPELARCLRTLAGDGAEDFYRGAIARSIDRDMRRHGGLLDAADLAAVGAPREREPALTSYGGRTAITLPAPGGGPQLIHALAELERRRDERWRTSPDAWYEEIAHAVRAAFRARARAHRPDRAAGPRRTLVAPGVGGEHGGETTHLCTADSDGNVVALTQSIQSLFGAKVANPDYGFLYNNYLLTCPRREHTHRLSGGCQARSNAAPTMLIEGPDDASVLAVGAAGSRRIVSSLVHVISGVIDLGLTLPEALRAPRVHPRMRRGVWLERPAATPSLVEALEQFGSVELRRPRSYSMGAVQALELRSGGEMVGAADPRREGTAVRC